MKILKNKKGMALENAILFMLIIFTFCALLTSLTLYGHYQTKLEKVMMTNRVELDKIGEEYLTCEIKKDFTSENENYDCTATDNVLTVWRKNDSDKIVILYVEVGEDGKTIEKWCYGTPIQE